MAKAFAFIVPCCVLALCAGAQAGSEYGLGVEGFRDQYQEPGPGVDSHADYGSLTGLYNYNWPGAFIGLDGRASYGSDDYSSPSGQLDGVPQWEFELRERMGPRLLFFDNILSPYIGIGERYYLDEGKGKFTNLGYYAYDRRIFQLYVPVGVTYNYVTPDKWTITPTVEYDRLFYGNVNSRLENGGGPNLVNQQNTGYGLRGDVMVGQEYGTYGWQIGPFIRYWNVRQSDYVVAAGLPPGEAYVEPYNERTQIGVALRVLW